jgi:hypothetical protein
MKRRSATIEATPLLGRARRISLVWVGSMNAKQKTSLLPVKKRVPSGEALALRVRRGSRCSRRQRQARCGRERGAGHGQVGPAAAAGRHRHVDLLD